MNLDKQKRAFLKNPSSNLLTFFKHASSSSDESSQDSTSKSAVYLRFLKAGAVAYLIQKDGKQKQIFVWYSSSEGKLNYGTIDKREI
jgi:hypothetical protein